MGRQHRSSVLMRLLAACVVPVFRMTRISTCGMLTVSETRARCSGLWHCVRGSSLTRPLCCCIFAFDWGVVLGPPDTPYSDHYFTLRFNVPKQYPLAPPKVWPTLFALLRLPSWRL